MSRKTSLLAFASLLFLLCSGLSLAQSSSTTTPPAQARPGGRGGNGEPCWQQAGIQKSVMEQRWSIERETRSQIEGICSNSSLTPQQKHQQAHEIREQGRQKMEGLVTPEQEKTLTSCQQERGMNHPGGGQGMGGGCGEWQHNGANGNPNGAPSGGNGNGNPPPPSSTPKS